MSISINCRAKLILIRSTYLCAKYKKKQKYSEFSYTFKHVNYSVTITIPIADKYQVHVRK